MASPTAIQSPSRRTSFADDEESQPLTTKSDRDINDARKLNFPRKPTGISDFFRAYILALHFVVILLALLLLRDSNANTDVIPLAGESWSPVQPFIQYEVKGEHADHNNYNHYSGPPTTEKDAAWTHLLRPLAFNATLDELRMAGESIGDDLAGLDGGGYLASLGVYHELHCLRKLRHYLYRERYFHNLTQDQIEYTHAHLDHCIDALRLTIMCHGSTEVYSFAWDNPTSYKPAAKTSARSVCVKWSSIEEWAYSRMTSYEDVVRLPPTV